MIIILIGLYVCVLIALLMVERAYDRGKKDGLRLADEIIDNFIKQQEEKDGTKNE